MAGLKLDCEVQISNICTFLTVRPTISTPSIKKAKKFIPLFYIKYSDDLNVINSKFVINFYNIYLYGFFDKYLRVKLLHSVLK